MSDLIVSGNNTEYKNPTIGLVQAVCAFVEDLGTELDLEGRPTKKCVLCFELDEKMDDGKPFMVSKKYTMSLGKKANLRRDLASWRSKDFTDDELKGFNLSKLKGVNCFLSLTEIDRKDGGKRVVIQTINSCPKNTTPIKIFNQKPPEWIAKQRFENNSKNAPELVSGQPKRDDDPFLP